jgi:hypothetical protein
MISSSLLGNRCHVLIFLSGSQQGGFSRAAQARSDFGPLISTPAGRDGTSTCGESWYYCLKLRQHTDYYWEVLHVSEAATKYLLICS